MYKFAIYDDNDNVVAWGETTTAPEDFVTDLGRVEVVESLDDFLDAMPAECSGTPH